MNVGDMADFVDWQQQVLGKQPAFFSRREKLWDRMLQRLDPKRCLFVLEFGVALGYSTNWWLHRLRGRDVVWHGFDRFTGIPGDWRAFKEGAYDSRGKPPPIYDDRVHWHVGDVIDTLVTLDFAAARDTQWLVLFDLGRYEPTAFAWDLIGRHLLPGDLVYLDEAAHPDERRILNEMILPSVDPEIIGTTPTALGLAVTGLAHRK